MSIEAVSQSSNFTRIQASDENTKVSARPVQRDPKERQNERPPLANEAKERSLIDALAQALNSVGLSLPPPPEKNSASGDAAGNSRDGSKKTDDVGQALQSFTNTLVQSIQSQSPEAPLRTDSEAKQDGDKDDAANALAGGIKAYGGDLASKAQVLLQDLNSQDGPKVSPTANKLDAAFKELVQVLQKSSDGATSNDASQTTLTSFLQKFVQNLQATGGASTLGGAVNELA